MLDLQSRLLSLIVRTPSPPALDVRIYPVALYESTLINSNTFHSYEAAEDNQISFNEGDKITEIKPASEDWGLYTSSSLLI
jgi:hypothetical protein